MEEKRERKMVGTWTGRRQKRERVQKPSEREQLGPQEKLSPSADERRAESRFSDKWDNAT